jgi:uncharacterized protein
VPRLRLSQLVYYPIKSAAGTQVTSWEVDGFGLRHDRRWMVVDPTGRHVTQRSSPRLALVRPRISDGRLLVEARGTAPLELELAPDDGATITVTVWDDTCEATLLGDPAAQWFSRYLDTPCRLVYMAERTIRPVDPDYAPTAARVSFSDAFPFLLLSEESLADLNSRMTQPLPMNRFRPNLVIAGGEAYIEDRLQGFEIGRIRFRGVKPCARCVVTTTDQETSGRGVEPLRTLATYRKVGGEVMFGQNVVHLGTGRLSVGEAVLV